MYRWSRLKLCLALEPVRVHCTCITKDIQTFSTPSTQMIKILCWVANKHGRSDRHVLITMINLTRNISTLRPLELKYWCTTNVLSVLWNVNTGLVDWCSSCIDFSWSFMLSRSCLSPQMDNLDLSNPSCLRHSNMQIDQLLSFCPPCSTIYSLFQEFSSLGCSAINGEWKNREKNGKRLRKNVCGQTWKSSFPSLIDRLQARDL